MLDFQTKMKAFRVLLVYKYLQAGNKNWSQILEYWYAVDLHPITNQRWDNNYPHNQEIENIPPYFKKCLIEFKQYHSKFGNNINEKIDSKKIYNNLMNEKKPQTCIHNNMPSCY